MDIKERIESTKYWLDEFNCKNCGYKEFSCYIAEDVDVYLKHMQNLEKAIELLAKLYSYNGYCELCPAHNKKCEDRKNSSDCIIDLIEWAKQQAGIEV